MRFWIRSRDRAIAIAALLIVACPAAGPLAVAETAGPPQATLTPAEAQHALEVMQDPAKRDALIETLRTIAKASPPNVQAAAPGAPSVLAADGFGAEALQQLSAQMGDLSTQFGEGVRAVTKAPLLWRWLTETATDREAQDRALSILWRGLAVAALAILAELVVRFALRRPMAALDGRAAGDRRREGVERAETLHARQARGWRMMLGRIPYAAVRLIFELAPVVAFAAAGNFLLTTSVGADPVARVAVLALVNAYVFWRAAMCLLRMVVCSPAPGTSLVAVSPSTAAAVELWSRWIVGVAVFGLALADVARALGLDRPAYFALVKLVVLIPHLLLVVVTLRCRRVVASFLRAPAGRTGFVAILRNRFAAVWHDVAIFANLALWAIWAFRIPNGYSLVAWYASEAIVIFAIARGLYAVAVGALERTLSSRSGFLASAPSLGTAVARYRPALRLTISTVVTLLAVGVLLEGWGVDVLSWFDSGRVGAILLSQATSVVIAVAIAALVWEVCNSAIERQLARAHREGAYARAARLRTLLPMLRTVLIATILTIAGLTVLSSLGVNIAPLLAGAASSASRSVSAPRSSCRTSSPACSFCSRTRCRSATG